jgi:hypothetical protein
MKPKISLNGEDINLDIGDINSLSSIIDRVAKEKLDGGELINNVLVNGTEIDEKSKDLSLAEIELVEMTTIKNPVMEVVSLLNKMLEYLINLGEGLTVVSDGFRIGSPEEASKMLFSAIEGIESFSELIDTVELLTRSDTNSVDLSNKSVEIESHKNELSRILKEIQSAQENKDWVNLADKLEYELKPALELWGRLIPEIIGELMKGTN